MSQFDFIEKSEERTPMATKIYIKKAFDIIERIHEIIHQQNLTQKEIAKRMGKSEAEVSKWINGVQNFTIKTLSKLEAALGQEVIHVPNKGNWSEFVPFYERYPSSTSLEMSIGTKQNLNTGSLLTNNMELLIMNEPSPQNRSSQIFISHSKKTNLSADRKILKWVKMNSLNVSEDQSKEDSDVQEIINDAEEVSNKISNIGI